MRAVTPRLLKVPEPGLLYGRIFPRGVPEWARQAPPGAPPSRKPPRKPRRPRKPRPEAGQ